MNRVKTQATAMEKTFANYASEKGLTPRRNSESPQRSNSRPNSPTEKRAEGLQRRFFKEDTQTGNEQMQRRSASLRYGNTSQNHTGRYFTPIQTVTLKTNTHNNRE